MLSLVAKTKQTKNKNKSVKRNIVKTVILSYFNSMCHHCNLDLEFMTMLGGGGGRMEGGGGEWEVVENRGSTVELRQVLNPFDND